MSCVIQKLVNSEDGGKKIKEVVIVPELISEKKSELVCPDCKNLGVRTKHWKNDLYACKVVDCDVQWYWNGGVCFV